MRLPNIARFASTSTSASWRKDMYSRRRRRAIEKSEEKAESEVAIVRPGVDIATVVGPTAAKGARGSAMLLRVLLRLLVLLLVRLLLLLLVMSLMLLLMVMRTVGR